MIRRTTKCIVIVLQSILTFGPCLALATPSREKKPVYRPLETAKKPGTKAARPFAVRPQVSALRPGQTATLLPDGSSLLIGGEANGRSLATAAITDARTGAPVTVPGRLHRARAWHSATMLPDGRVLIVGGIGDNGGVVRSAEIFDPGTQTFNLLPESEGAARAYHTATLLLSGQVLITGGTSGQGAASSKALLWDFKTGAFTSLSDKLSTARQKHRAILLHDGNVLIEGGNGNNDNRIDATELFNVETGTFSISNITAAQADLRDAFLTLSIPTNDARDVALDASVGIVFSKLLRVESINIDTLVLNGPERTLKTRVVPAENGKLAFVTPLEPLLPGVSYTLSVSGIIDAGNQAITPASISFTTKGEPDNRNSLDSDDWVPDEGNLHGNWTSKFKDSQWRSLPPLQAKEGETALAGQTLMLDGRPLDNVTLRIGNSTTVSDNTGRFLLTNIQPGHQVLTIDGRTANRNRITYGIFKVGVEIKQGKTTALEYTIWMTKLDLARAKKIPSPTASRTVVTNPKIPGLELVLPENTVIRDIEGKTVTEISITPIPTNQPPFPLPPGIDVPVYFTIQPGGSQIIPPRAQLIYPNFINSKPGTRIDFWNYDATEKGWYVYGKGTVTSDGKQIVPDPGVVLYEFSGAMVAIPSLAPILAAIDEMMNGDPVNLGTGLLIVEKTDLTLPDLIPISVTRTYRQNDSRSRAFGIGASHPYEVFLVGTSFPYTYQDLILPDGKHIHYDRVSPGTGWADAVYDNVTVPGPYYKSQITWNGNGWNLKLKDGTLMTFPDGLAASQPRHAALLSVTDRFNNTLTLQRDTDCKLTKIISPHNRWVEFTYDTSARIRQATDNIGRTVVYEYDTGGRLWKVTDVNQGITEYTYDSSDRMLTIKDPRGIVYLTNEYDPVSGRVIKQTLADDTPANSTDNPTYLFNYTTDSGGRIVQTDVTDPRNHVQRVTFSTTGYSLSQTSALGTAEEQTVTFEREAGTNLVRAVVDPLGRRTEYNYDPMGNMTSVIEFAGTASAATTTMTYEPTFNQLASITDPLNHTTHYDFDPNDNSIVVRDALDHQTRFTFNSKGQVTSRTDPLLHVTQLLYEGADLAYFIDPLNRTTSLYTDSAGRLIKIADPAGNRTRFEYNAFNQIKKIIEHSGATSEITYDGNGNTLSIKDARNQTTSYTYDNMDRVISRTDSLQGATSTETFEYDVAGNAVKLIDRRGKVTTIDYDNLDRPTFVGYGVTAGPTYESTATYTYDLYDRITQVVDSVAGTMTMSFDDLARTASETSPQGTIGFTYDQVGRLIAKSISGQPTISYGYDNANRLLSITQGLASVGFTYDSANRRSSLTLPNGIVVDSTFDDASQLTGLTYRNGPNVLGDLTYAYDKSGRRTSMGGSLARTALPQPMSGPNYNAANRLTQKGSTTLTYDANGNLTNDGTNTYTWDARNQLVGISGAVAASFQYDAFGRRVRTTVNGSTKDYMYDGLNVVQEKVGGSPTANMLTGDVDEVFSRTESATQSVLADGLGSTLSLLDSAGTAQTNYTYEPFGNTSVSGSASSNPSQYTGRDNDSTGLYYYRARYYSPTLQRFISEDPIDFMGGDTNLYSYVGNSPCNFTDPTGQFLAGACLMGALMSVATDLLFGRKFSMKSLAAGCLMGMAFALAGRALGALLRALAPKIPRLLRLGRAGNGPQCFVAGTLIKTKDGDKPIENIRAGDWVMSYDPERSDSASVTPEAGLVTRTFVREADQVIDLRVGNSTITTTTEHPFWVIGAGWTAAGELRRGSALLTKDGIVVHVDTIERREGKFKVYNFEVANNHTYFVGSSGILVHNQCGGKRWPKTAEEMDDLLGMKGQRVPDGNFTGRNKVEWRPSDKVKITFERHPYHPNAPAHHRDYHYHLKYPGTPHARYLPGDLIP